ncbi:unnamed protein product [Protopolystoma xenopodis]|uniref:Uncharacterized protein n=1 Tax=Protopolystoma xenopodis TaxID=117903 RepID=A0A448WDJ0_9PLAT|nr:unnamed protein product [Protopolystoma xenopodis]
MLVPNVSCSCNSPHLGQKPLLDKAHKDKISPDEVTAFKPLGGQGVTCAVLGHPGFVYSVDFCPRPGNNPNLQSVRSIFNQILFLATSCFDKIVRIWAVNGKRVKLLQELQAHQKNVNSVAWAGTDLSLYSGDASGTIAIWQFIPPELDKRDNSKGKTELPSWSLLKVIQDPELLASFCSFYLPFTSLTESFYSD